MNWITNFVKPKLQSIVGKKEVPDNLWETCPKCSQMIRIPFSYSPIVKMTKIWPP